MSSLRQRYRRGISKRTQPELADGTLLGDLLRDDGFGLSTLDFLLLCKGLVGATLLGCLNLLISNQSRVFEIWAIRKGVYHCE